jgi:Zn-dependent peptidase ImmA (M78 family)
VHRIAKLLGVEVREEPNPDESISGFLVRNPSSGNAVIGVNKNHSYVRRRFTIAHELGHFLLHAHGPVRMDRSGYGTGYSMVYFRDDASSLGVDPEEREANFFAAELLMPIDKVLREVQSRGRLDVYERSSELQDMAKKFKVSQAALTNRLYQLGLLTVD